MRNQVLRVGRFAGSVRVLLALATTAAAWLVALAHLTAALHFALISHEICADHGELVHGHGASSVVARAPSTRGSVALPAGEHATHEHCPVWGRRHDQAAVLDAPNARLSVLSPATALISVDEQGACPTRAELLLSAPKQSPPV